jgi:CheY-like chemotaxis protein
LGKGKFFFLRRLFRTGKNNIGKKSNSGYYSLNDLNTLGLSDKDDKSRNKVYLPKGEKLALVVDDDDNIAKLIRSWLEIKGFNVFTANNGSKAIELLEEHKFCLITTDIVMPELDGTQLINYVKSNPELYHIPIIVLSILDKSDLGNFFADAYIKKPFDGFDLLKVVDEIF